MCAYVKEFTISWKIENFSFSWHKCGEAIKSPEFIVDIFECTKWHLLIYPKSKNGNDYIGCFLERDESGPQEMHLNVEISFLGSDDTTLIEKKLLNESFVKHVPKGYFSFVKRDLVFAGKKAEFLPQDVLTVNCSLWTNDTTNEFVEEFARTRIEVVRRLISGTVDGFSSLSTNEARSVSISSATDDIAEYRMNLQLTDGTNCDENLMLQIILPENQRKKFSTCKVYLIDAVKNRLACGRSAISFEQEEDWKFPLFPTKWKLLANKNLYLCNDILSLECEIIISTGNLAGKIEVDGSDRILKGLDTISIFGISGDISASSSALEDLGRLYRDQVLCDVTLKSGTESFSAHTVILSARSSVFRAMFTSDMQEKTNACVNICDFDSETVRQLLLYAYTDTVVLDWHSALKLYAAADKYEIMSLKEICTKFLKNSLRPSKACELLVLADTHQDIDFKKFIQNYIFQNDDQIFGTEQWKDLEQKYPQLFVETLSQMYKNARAF